MSWASCQLPRTMESLWPVERKIPTSPDCTWKLHGTSMLFVSRISYNFCTIFVSNFTALAKPCNRLRSTDANSSNSSNSSHLSVCANSKGRFNQNVHVFHSLDDGNISVNKNVRRMFIQNSADCFKGVFSMIFFRFCFHNIDSV